LKKRSTQRAPAAGEVFGERLRELRAKRGLTQQALADLVGIPNSHVSAMERGVKLPTLLTVLRLAVALECKASALISVFDRADLHAIVAK
jgi:transcriptional regulator with XRE-family HTH domain